MMSPSQINLSRHPRAEELFAASAGAMITSLICYGGIVAIALAAAGETHSLLDVIAAVASGALIGLIAGPIKFPISVLVGSLLFLIIGRFLISHELNAGAYRQWNWVVAGAALGCVVQMVIIFQLVDQRQSSLDLRSSDFIFLIPGLITGVAGMLTLRKIARILVRWQRECGGSSSRNKPCDPKC